MRRLAFIRGPDLGEECAEGSFAHHAVKLRAARDVPVGKDRVPRDAKVGASEAGFSVSSSEFYAEVTGLAQCYIVISDDEEEEAIVISDDEPLADFAEDGSEEPILPQPQEVGHCKSFQPGVSPGRIPSEKVEECPIPSTSSSVHPTSPSTENLRAANVGDDTKGANQPTLVGSDTDSDTSEDDEALSCRACGRYAPSPCSCGEHLGSSSKREATPQYSIPKLNKGYQILQRSMGWNEQRGLGKAEQGRRVPILPLMKLGKAGIGSLCRPLAVRSVKAAGPTCRLRNELRELARRERYKERRIKAELDSADGDATGSLPHVVAMRRCY